MLNLSITDKTAIEKFNKLETNNGIILTLLCNNESMMYIFLPNISHVLHLKYIKMPPQYIIN